MHTMTSITGDELPGVSGFSLIHGGGIEIAVVFGIQDQAGGLAYD